MDQPYLFLAYASEDQQFADALATRLGQKGIRTWTDKEISAGANWAKAIEEGLAEAAALAYVASKHSANSISLQRLYPALLEVATDKEKPLIPIIIDDSGIESLPGFLRMYSWVDFREDFDTALSRLIWGITGENPLLQSSEPVPQTTAHSRGYVFISYAAEDDHFVMELKTYLKHHGYAYWDFRESARDYQRDYSSELEDIIKQAKATLAIVSPHWKGSEVSRQELHFSREVGTPVFLLMVRNPGPTLAISGKSYIDFTSGHDKGFQALEREMTRVLN